MLYFFLSLHWLLAVLTPWYAFHDISKRCISFLLHIHNRRSIIHLIPITFLFFTGFYITSLIVSIKLLFLFNYRHFLILDSLTWGISTRQEEIHNINRYRIYLHKIHCQLYRGEVKNLLCIYYNDILISNFLAFLNISKLIVSWITYVLHTV